MPLLPADPTAYFAVANVKTSIMYIRAGRSIRTTITNLPAIRKKDFMNTDITKQMEMVLYRTEDDNVTVSAIIKDETI